jgi:DNA polymerase-1
VLVLAVQYGMEAGGLADRLGIHHLDAKALLQQHKTTFATYWRWSDAWYAAACSRGCVETVFGWQMRIGSDSSERSIRNWPIQSHGAEILRVACILADRVGVELLFPMHDAVMVEAPIANIDHAIALTRECMRRASRIVLDGFELRTEAKVFRYPDRYREEDERAAEVWQRTHLAEAV